ncbi:MAG TPA: glycosyltransferase, partial [Verrucomicrobiae bacterium]|nr:glycosyltransferase [Verrucomicrobiae bacterium]
MFRNRIYYKIKPMVPPAMRLSVRRWFAMRKREKVKGIWPIMPGSETPPQNWPGWPDGKKFAFVLTHDVEGPNGLEKCRELMKLEMELGFRSSFNFIPEGPYTVSKELRDELTRNGFEVGVHDLRHDGKLYTNRNEFKQKAARINKYLKNWGAVGFRSGFMLHNLNWLHDLDVAYDSSSFDTDPFEPQPDGVGTIFPFWVPVPQNRKPETRSSKHQSQTGYVELPYTLPQDSTLFLLFRDTRPDIWFQKLDWIIEHGGMALLNVHPDYLRFANDRHARHTFPVDFYKRFLGDVKSRYMDQCWHVLPKQIAAHVALTCEHAIKNSEEEVCLTKDRSVPRYEMVPTLSLSTGESWSPVISKPNLFTKAPITPGTVSENLERTKPPEIQNLNFGHQDLNSKRLHGKRVAVVLFSHYPADPRPRRAAEALAREGAEIDFLCLRGNPTEARREISNGMNIFRVPLKRRRGGKLAYLFQYSAFISAAFAFLARRSLGRRYDLVHVHNMPDILVFSAIVPKLLGAKIILDLHDPMPELMMTIFNLGPNSLAVRFLKKTEKWSIGFADLALTPNIAFKRLFTSRSCPREKMQIVMNSPNNETFGFRPVSDIASAPDKPDSTKSFVILYHGSLVARHGLDIAIDALELVRKSIPNATIMICGESTPYFEKVMESVQKRGLGSAVRYMGMRNRKQIVEAIEHCDIGVIPNRRSVFTEINMPTRIFEYL